MTSGDRLSGRLQDQGGKGLFTKELDEALLDGRIDCAIHSMKDLPTRMPPGIVLAAVPAREDQRDAFIAMRAKNLAELPASATVGTASLRRQAQTLHLRPDLKVELLRGRVETRLAKIESGAFDATYLALAGLRRLGLEQHATAIVDPTEMPPALKNGGSAPFGGSYTSALLVSGGFEPSSSRTRLVLSRPMPEHHTLPSAGLTEIE